MLCPVVSVVSTSIPPIELNPLIACRTGDLDLADRFGPRIVLEQEPTFLSIRDVLAFLSRFLVTFKVCAYIRPVIFNSSRCELLPELLEFCRKVIGFLCGFLQIPVPRESQLSLASTNLDLQ